MCLETTDTRRRHAPAPVSRLYRRLLHGGGVVMMAAISAACSLLDSPETIASKQASQALEGAVREQVETLAQQGKERIVDAITAGKKRAERIIAFPKPDGTVGMSERGWPVIHIEQVAAQHPPQLVLEGPVRGVVFLDDTQIGLVQAGTVRVLTLTVGEHQIRIEHPLAPAMTAQFHIETGERIRLRWETR